MAQTTRLEIPEWTGSTLTVGAFTQYAERVLAAFQLHGFGPLALDEIGPELEAAVQRLSEFINSQRSYDETPAIAKADANRDALWKAFYHAWHYLMQLDPAHPLYVEAVKLRSEMTSYKGVERHEISKETSELQGLFRDLENQRNAQAIQQLGFARVVSAMREANDQVRQIIENREVERGNRIADKGGDTTASLRKGVANLLVEAYRQVNAAARINNSDVTRNAINDVNGIIAHYKDVAAQPAKRPGKDEPEPEPAPEPTPEPGGAA